MPRRLSDISLRAKITISFVLIVVLGTAVSTLIGSRIVTRAMLNEARKQVRHGLSAAWNVYTARLDTVQRSVAGAAQTEELALALGSQKWEALPAVLAKIRDQNRLQFLSFVEARDRFIIRASRTGESRPDPGPAPVPEYIDGAMSGAVMAGTEILSCQDLILEDPAMAECARMTILPDRDGKNPPGEVKDGMILVAASPVMTSSGFRGVLYGGILLNRDESLVAQINDSVFGTEAYGDGTGGIVSIFMGDIRVATNVRLPSGQPAFGGRASEDIRRTVLSEGNPYYGNARISGIWYLTACKPIRNSRENIIGFLGVGVPEDPFLAVRTSMMLTFLLVAGIGVLVVLGITYFITRSIFLPLEEIARASDRIAAGDLDQPVRVSSGDEIGILANSFNKMQAGIKAMKLELEEWGRTLEEKVKKRTEELVAVQNQMAQSEKLASLGRMAAGIAHEINNPLAGILTFSMLALEDCDDDHPMKHNLEVIVKQTLRCRDTVKGLLDFARQSTSAPSLTDVNTVVDSTLQLLEKQTIFQNIRTVRRFDPALPRILIDPGQLQQVIMNIVLNAVDAMEENGVLTIETSRSPETQEIVIRISDTGKGIPEEILPLIFEPFFTTKKVGKGTGLGLAIVHGIVTGAGGSVEASNSSEGAVFTIRLPIAQEAKGPDGTSQENTRPGTGQPSQRG
jgi:two-component system NtrC family sensor kinase